MKLIRAGRAGGPAGSVPPGYSGWSLSRASVVFLVVVGSMASCCAVPALATESPSSLSARVLSKGGAAHSVHARDFSPKPSTTEPYAACKAPAPHQAQCLSIIVPPGAQRTSPLNAPPSALAPGASPALEGSGELGGYSPADLQSAYKVSSTGGSGRTVAIVDAYDDPNAEADLKTYRSHYGLSECTSANGCFNKVNQKGEKGSYPAANYEWAAEISLDLDMASAMCAECHILLVEAKTNDTEDLGTAENEAATLGVVAISNSWGASESSEETTYDHFFEHSGIAITVAAGDEGYGVDYPAAAKSVISVGGTILGREEGGTRGWYEIAWEGSGGGCSAYESKPSWQTDWGCAGRTDNDTAAVASPKTPVSVYDSYGGAEGWLDLGGTSVAAPLVAGIEAHAGSTVRSEGAKAFYKHKLFDIAEGANGECYDRYLCTTKEGYDGPTGWGSPDGLLETSAGFQAITGPAIDLSGVNHALTKVDAVLTGYIYPEEHEISYYFEYGKTTSYGTTVPVSGAKIAAGGVWQAVKTSVEGLEKQTLYHYRLVAVRGGETLDGKDQTFTTPSLGLQTAVGPTGTKYTELTGVNCVSAAICTAVGAYVDSSEHVDPIAEQWFGNKEEWSLQTVPDPSGATESYLTGVSCASEQSCVAVGWYASGGSRATTMYAESWNGKEWTIKTTPAPSGSSESRLNGVSCVSSTNCIAVGSSKESSGASIPIAESWSGTGWSLQTMIDPESSTRSEALGVSCVTASDCQAVGYYRNPTTNVNEALGETYSGSGKWSLSLPENYAGATDTILAAISCASSTSCTAVGHWNKTVVATALVEEYGGGGWRIAEGFKAPETTESELNAVSCASAAECVAAGESDTETALGFGWFQPVVERGTGEAGRKAWSQQTSSVPQEPIARGAEPSTLLGVSCQPGPACTTVGRTFGSTALAERLTSEPGVYAGPAEQIGAVVATLTGKVNPDGYETEYWFEYGETMSYGHATRGVTISSGTSDVVASAAISRLKPGATYHYRLVASNSSGTELGPDGTFTAAQTEWRLGGSALGEPAASSWTGTVKLSDEAAPHSTVECKDSASGTAGAGAAGEVTSLTVSSCVTVEEASTSCKNGTIEVKAVNLPWHAEVVTVTGTTHVTLSNGGKGTPGFKMECETKFLGTKGSFECTGTLAASTANTTSGVTATWLASEKLACGGEPNKGKVEGSQAIAASKGGKLAAINATEATALSNAEWNLGGSSLSQPTAIGWSGSLKLTDEAAPQLAVKCNTSASGTAAVGLGGEVATWSASSCVPVEETSISCKSGKIEVKALNLPWRVELVEVEGTTRIALTGSGKGAAGFKMECESKFGGAKASFECTGAPVGSTTNVTAGITETLLASEKLACGSELNKGKLEGSQTITATKGGKLEAV